MKKNILFVLALIGLTASVLAISNIGDSIYSSYGTTNAANMLDTSSNYAVLTYANLNSTNGTNHCPIGDFSLQSDGSCQETDSGKKITGWAIINFKDNSTNSTVVHSASSIYVKSGNYNDGCGSECNMTTTYRVFQTSSLAGSSTDWTEVNSISVNYGTTREDIMITSGDIDAVLVARYAGSNERPDPRVYVVKVNN